MSIAHSLQQHEIPPCLIMRRRHRTDHNRASVTINIRHATMQRDASRMRLSMPGGVGVGGIPHMRLNNEFPIFQWLSTRFVLIQMTLAANKYKSAPHAQTQRTLTPNFSLDATRRKISRNNNKMRGALCVWYKNRECACYTHPAVRRIGFERAAAVLLIAKRRISEPGCVRGSVQNICGIMSLGKLGNAFCDVGRLANCCEQAPSVSKRFDINGA